MAKPSIHNPIYALQGKENTMSLEYVDDTALQNAIELQMSDVFPAMNIANHLGGSGKETLAWKLARRERLAELVAEAMDRRLPVMKFRCSVTDKTLTECRAYLRLHEEIGGALDIHSQSPIYFTVE